jgi:hypothetical protein
MVNGTPPDPRQAQADALILRRAAEVLQRRSPRQPFTLRVLVKTLLRLAARLDPPGWPAGHKRGGDAS